MGGRGAYVARPSYAPVEVTKTIKAKLSPTQERVMGEILREYDRVWSPSTNPESRVSPEGRLRPGTIWSTVSGASPRTYGALEGAGLIEVLNNSGTFPVVKVLARPEK